MSSSIVCQGLKSSLELCLEEQRVPRQKLTRPADTIFSQNPGRICILGMSHDPDKEDINHSDGIIGSEKCKTSHVTSWSFLDAVHIEKEDKVRDEVSVQYFVKRSSSTLCAHNLDMCTENLGCETGSNASNVSDDVPLLSLEFGSDPTKQSSIESKLNIAPKKLENRSSFPPPLTSITGLGGVQVRPQREDGRLVLRAVTVNSHNPCFHAERVNGRLRLQFMNNFSQEYDDLVDEVECSDEEEGNLVSNDEVETDEEHCDLNETDETSSWNTEEWKENSCDVEGELGIGNFPKRSRCKEDGSGEDVLLNQERFLVAT